MLLKQTIKDTFEWHLDYQWIVRAHNIFKEINKKNDE